MKFKRERERERERERASVYYVEVFLGEVFMVRNTVNTEKFGCSAVICRKQSALKMQFLLIELSIFLKTCVKDHGDCSSRLLEKEGFD